MVITDSCEIDKKFTTSIYAAVCSQMSNKAALRQSIALREVFAAFYTPEMPGILTEGFVDLRAIFRVSFTSIACHYEEHDAGNRPVDQRA